MKMLKGFTWRGGIKAEKKEGASDSNTISDHDSLMALYPQK